MFIFESTMNPSTENATEIEIFHCFCRFKTFEEVSLTDYKTLFSVIHGVISEIIVNTDLFDEMNDFG